MYNLLRLWIGAGAGGCLLNRLKKRYTQLIPGVKECDFKRQQDAKDARRDKAGDRSQPRTCPGGEDAMRAAAVINQHRKCPRRDHAQAETTSGDSHHERGYRPSQGRSGQRLRPLNSRCLIG